MKSQILSLYQTHSYKQEREMKLYIATLLFLVSNVLNAASAEEVLKPFTQTSAAAIYRYAQNLQFQFEGKDDEVYRTFLRNNVPITRANIPLVIRTLQGLATAFGVEEEETMVILTTWIESLKREDQFRGIWMNATGLKKTTDIATAILDSVKAGCDARVIKEHYYKASQTSAQPPLNEAAVDSLIKVAEGLISSKTWEPLAQMSELVETHLNEQAREK